jgi:stage V sporulation protein AD
MPGKIVDGTISDASNMGAAMAPAAADSIISYFEKSGACFSDFDFVVTGDLGHVGSAILKDILSERGLSRVAMRHIDCGTLLYDSSVQDAHAGASGCGCSASVLASKFLPLLERGEAKDILFLSTGALMSPTSVQQGENIFGIAPLIHLTTRE